MSNKELPNVKHDSELQKAIKDFGMACAYKEVEQRIAAALKLEDAICGYARAALAAQPDAPASDWPDVSPAGLRKMAEIAAPNNGAVFRAAADEIERLSAERAPELTDDLEHAVASACVKLATQPLEQKPVEIDGIVSEAMRRYLRTCQSGGMSRKRAEFVQACVDDAERLNYFKLAIAQAILSDRAHQAQPEQVAQDSARLDWLCQQFVTVRIPLRYGSRECFMGSPDDNDGESVPWDIRSKIDAARASGQEGEKQ